MTKLGSFIAIRDNPSRAHFKRVQDCHLVMTGHIIEHQHHEVCPPFQSLEGGEGPICPNMATNPYLFRSSDRAATVALRK